MNDITLSICISSYNHGDKCMQLVERILSVQDKRYNIFICDDHSDENTVRGLKKLSDPRITLVQNRTNLGPCKNWYKTIDCGTGRYILHVLDRDIIAVEYLPIILDILENNLVGGGYFGKSMLYPVKGITKRKNYAICNKGREAFLTMAGVPIHPTGFLVRRAIWKKGNYGKFFNQRKYGIYPHSYILGEIATKNDMVYSPIPFYSFAYRGSNKISRFYDKNKNKDYWWMPQNTIKTDNRLIVYLSRIADDSYKEEFICSRFRIALNRATLAYKCTVENQMEMEHYGFTAKYISGWELLCVSIRYKIIFNEMLKKMEVNRKEIQGRLQNIWRDNLKVIYKEIKGKDVDKVLSISNRNLLRFNVMSQWVKAKQEKNNLSMFFERGGYKHIAIYGMGKMGQLLLNELQGTKTEVVYGIDRNADVTYSKVEILSLEDSLPQVDVVVVTIIESFSKIVQSLEEKIDCPIISLLDVVYDI